MGGAAENPGRGPYITTAKGGRFWPLDPHPREVSIRDIACSLSKTARYRGHTRRFYSVAEHSVLLARHLERTGARPDFVLWALLHDAAEAYLCDVPAPIKGALPGYAKIEAQVELAIARAFDCPCAGDGGVPSWVALCDLRIRADEIVQLERVDHAGDLDRWQPLGVELEFWPHDAAEWNFLSTFDRVTALRAPRGRVLVAGPVLPEGAA